MVSLDSQHATSPPSGLVLASASPRRRELLAALGYRFTVVPSQADETLLPGELPTTHVIRLSRAKALAIAERPDVPGRWFLGSDTVVVCDEKILGKPRDGEDAANMLRMLSGRRHQVYTGYAVYDRAQQRLRSGAAVTEVTFRPLTEAEIAGYIASGEPLDKAGAYAIQGLGAALVRRIEGSYSNVVGLPQCEILEVLLESGLPSPLSEPE